MDTGKDTTNRTALSELAARANRQGFELNHRPGHIFKYQLVGPMVTQEGLAEMLDKFGTSPAAPKAQTEIVHTDGWGELYDCMNLLGVLPRALESEEGDTDLTPLEYQAQTRAISSKLGHGMHLLECWHNDWRAEGGSS